MCCSRFLWTVAGSIKTVGGGGSGSGILISLSSQKTDERCLSGWHSDWQARPL